MTQRLIGILGLTLFLLVVTQATAADLPIKRVVLFSNGVGYFEREGTVRDHARVELSFKYSEMDDILKSLLVLDLGKGRVGAVTYDSATPGSIQLEDIPFALGGVEEESLGAVLGQMQGVRLTVTTASGRVTGSVLTVGKAFRMESDDSTRTESVEKDPVLVLVSDEGTMFRVRFSEIRSLQILDEQSRSVVARYLDAKLKLGRREAKKLSITSDGEGERSLLVGYSLAAPIWKTTYRVAMREGKPAFFQGWAIVDNVSDEDWTDVTLSLVSGTPISFVQPLQQPLFMHRAVVPIPDNLRLYPQRYEPEGGAGSGFATGYGAGVGPGGFGRVPGGVPGGVVGGVPGGVTGGVLGGVSGSGRFRTSLSDLIAEQQAGVTEKATGKEVGDLFEYKIDQPVSIRKNSSALLPILQTDMDAQRVSIFRTGEDSDRPRTGLVLTNNSPLTLESGSLTVLDGDTYAGEALLERLKPEERRFISFGVDQGTLVNSKADERLDPVFLVRVKGGALQAHYYRARSRTYEIRNQTGKPRVLYIEHPRENGWTLTTETQAPSETTAQSLQVPGRARSSLVLEPDRRRSPAPHGFDSVGRLWL